MVGYRIRRLARLRGLPGAFLPSSDHFTRGVVRNRRKSTRLPGRPFYSTTNHPFALPETGKIAVKVINHHGDEVLMVYEIV